MIQFYAKVDKRGLKVHLKVSKPIVIGGNSVNFTYKLQNLNLNLLHRAGMGRESLFYETYPKLYILFGKMGQIMWNYAGLELFLILWSLK